MSENDLVQKNSVPFDPGFGVFVSTFSPNYFFVDNEVRKVKDIKQRKMKYKAYEPTLLKLCDTMLSFYFLGMLYGAYLKNKFKDAPKEILGNDFLGLNLEQCKNGEVTIELRTLETFIKNNAKNPFATRKLPEKYVTIIDNYIDFLEQNEYFIGAKTTADLKIPSGLEHINSYSKKKLSALFELFEACIKSGKLEKVMDSEEYELIK